MKKVWCWSSNAVILTIVHLVSHWSFCQQDCNPATVKKKNKYLFLGSMNSYAYFSVNGNSLYS